MIGLILEHYKKDATLGEMRAKIKEGVKQKSGASITLNILTPELQKEAEENSL